MMTGAAFQQYSQQSMHDKIGRLHVLTDFHFQQIYTHAELTEMAIEGGADTIQFRQKHGSFRDILHEAEATARVCASRGATLLINDRVDVALAVGADGVHLGQTDMPLTAARRILGPDAIIGITTPTISLAKRAEQDGADYVGFGPVFATHSKASSINVQGLEAVLEICNSINLPVIGIAGITPNRAPDVIRAGAHGVAVMSAVTQASDPVGATRQFYSAIESTPARI